MPRSVWKGPFVDGYLLKKAGAVRDSRIGFLGHTYPGMLDMYSDFTMVTAQTGAHIELLEMCDLDKCVRSAGDAEVRRKLAETRETFTLESCGEDDLNWAARVAASESISGCSRPLGAGCAWGSPSKTPSTLGSKTRTAHRSSLSLATCVPQAHTG